MYLRMLCLICLMAIIPGSAYAQPVLPPLPESIAQSPSPVFHYDANRFWFVSSRRVERHSGIISCGPLDVWAVDCPSCSDPCRSHHRSLSLNSCPAREQVLANTLTPGVPVCIVLHGSYVEWGRAVKYSWKTFRWLRGARPDEPLQMIYYTWPSDALTYIPQLDFNVLGKRASREGFYLARILSQIPPECPVCFIGHSQGTRAVSSMLHLLGGGDVQGYRLPPGQDRGHRIRVILTAAAIDHDWFNPGNRFGRGLCRTEAMLNLVNHRDWALAFYHIRTLDSRFAVGRVGFTRRDYAVMGNLAQRIYQMDVTREIGCDHNWSSYIARSDLAVSIAPYVYFSTRSQPLPTHILTPPLDVQPTRYTAIQ